MSEIFQLSDRFIADCAALDPMLATFWGMPGYDHELTDYSPVGWAARYELMQATLRELDDVRATNRVDRVAIDVMRERLNADCSLIESLEYYAWLSPFNSHHVYVREVFDFMPRQSEEDWSNVRSRLAAVPAALDGIKTSFDYAAERGRVAAVRQVEAAASQCERWGSSDGPFYELASECAVFDISAEAGVAADAFGSFAEWLERDYAAVANPHEPVGAERYGRLVNYHNGTNLDLAEAYEWGWSELHAIERRMAELVERLLPGGSRDECIAHLNTDPRYVVEGGDRFIAWNQDVIDRTLAELNGTHFDIPEPVRRCHAQAIPDGGPHMTYYTAPSEDFSRPGQTWLPAEGRTHFPLWDALTTAYHESTPGHHLQLAQMMYQAESLTRFQRLGVVVSGHGEGWALYAERLMLELGYLDDPAYEFGYLVWQALRAARVILDIGIHCELPIADDEQFHPGERWRAELALPFLLERTGWPEDYLASEVDRYLSMPGQAISYKIGERVWLEGRDRARRRLGEAFDLKDFHRQMLDVGSMGLDQLGEEFDRYGATPPAV
jgi:uncharacterized protein (DUF885 family)